MANFTINLLAFMFNRPLFRAIFQARLGNSTLFEMKFGNDVRSEQLVKTEQHQQLHDESDPIQYQLNDESQNGIFVDTISTTDHGNCHTITNR